MSFEFILKNNRFFFIESHIVVVFFVSVRSGPIGLSIGSATSS